MKRQTLLTWSLSLLVYSVFNLGFAQPKPIVLISAPEILAVKIQENHEPLVDLTDQNIVFYGPSPEIRNNRDYYKLRKSVYDKLVEAQKSLPPGYHFCIYEGYRSLSLQKMLFDKRFQLVQAAHPNWTVEEVFAETTKMVSPVVNLDGSNNVPPHSTGGAIDIYLVNDKGEPVDMGIHPRDWMKDVDGSLSATASKTISPVADQHRQLMKQTLLSVGLVNYPTEYWHWSYGDRYWAYFKKKPHAVYGSI